MRPLFVLPSLLGLAVAAGRVVKLPSQCSCGYHDPSSDLVYTDSIISYFNETATVDTDVFELLSYEYSNQKGWNTIFRQGASPSNVAIGNDRVPSWQDGANGTGDSSLEMTLDAVRFDHLSDGAEMRTLRRDIMYGTFRASMKSAKPWVGGSAMSMFLQFNESNSLEMDLLNMNDASQAKIMQTINGEYPDNNLATNYSIIQKGAPPKIPAQNPWDFLDLRFDWTVDGVSFWVGSNKTRAVTKDDRTLPNVPQPLYFSHWSTGDENFMEGPPINSSVANVRWVRAFFNSSLMTPADHVTYDQKCNATAACSIDDISLRGSSVYATAATIPWKQPVYHQRIRTIAGYVAAAFSVFGVASLLNAFIRRTPWHKIKKIYLPATKRHSTNALRNSLRPMSYHESVTHLNRSGVQTPAPAYASGAVTPLPGYSSGRGSPWESVASLHSPSGSVRGNSRRPSVANLGRAKGMGLHQTGIDMTEKAEEEEMTSNRNQAHDDLTGRTEDDISPVSGHHNDELFDEKANVRVLVDENGVEGTVAAVPEEPHQKTALENLKEKSGVPDALTGGATADPAVEQMPKKEPQQRIDYLAGLVAISCIMVTLRHFSLTFWPYVTEGSGQIMHFHADQVLSYILGPYVLTPLWIGPFFVTSCRFLAQRYLRTGGLADVANKMLLRAPRMLIPCFVFMTLEYFLISLGLTSKLQWLPSVSYSTWPYVQPQGNFGVFLNEVVELTYIIPNAAPEIINHYCVGVLWTIPVQLQFSFVTLLAAVLIRDIKKPWKRMLFYTLTIVAGWYASSWSACHWLGLLLADMDLTYNWIKWTQARWWALYPILLLATGMAVCSPLALLFNSAIYDWSFMAYENGIHPDILTGRPIIDTVANVWAAYPNYNTPSLAVLTFSVGLQIIVELSTWVQAALSTKVITFFHPHIMTIYLMHGFIFWSLGAYIAVALSATALPYWAILLIIAACCYTVILFLAVLITPFTEFATKGSTKNVWRWATEVPVPHRATTAPFSKALVIGRMQEEETGGEGAA